MKSAKFEDIDFEMVTHLASGKVYHVALINEMPWREFVNLLPYLFIDDIKKLRPYLTHLKRAYIEHKLSQIAADRLINSVTSGETNGKGKTDYADAGRRAV